jgi:hypothetical protein
MQYTYVRIPLTVFALQYIILAGGFGRCRYLLAALREHFACIEILQSRGWGQYVELLQ